MCWPASRVARRRRQRDADARPARRHLHIRYHTALHLICAALPGILATGNAIDTTKARIDFDLSASPSTATPPSARLNALIAGNHEVTTQWITDEQAGRPARAGAHHERGAAHWRRSRRLLKIGDGVDLQPCGGTLVRNTSEIGPVKIVKVENKGKESRLVIQLS